MNDIGRIPQPKRPVFKDFVIAPTVRKRMEDVRDKKIEPPIPVIISLSESKAEPQKGIGPSKDVVRKFLKEHNRPYRESEYYIFANLMPEEIEGLERLSEFVYQIWTDETCGAHLLHSVDTVKASASWRTFAAFGKGITWAVMDTGIQSDHPHFKQYDNIDHTLSQNFTNDGPDPDDKYEDDNGHGTHVAGIIAGEYKPEKEGDFPSSSSEVENSPNLQIDVLDGHPAGIAPRTKLVAIKVLDANASGPVSNIIRGLEYLRKLNEVGHARKIDGVNISLGYDFDPKWYGCGYSPLCQEVTRAVRAGLIVVISAGNSGYGVTTLNNGAQVPIWNDLSIADPANTEEAIAVGSSHKSSPHMYGVSYFSSKGPTGDGRMKPDLVAPGEKIISCALYKPGAQAAYREDSGTSMAAPHVSGAIAAFLSVRTEFRGEARMVKEIFLKSAMDLGREKAFQGAGLVDLMKALMSV
jgi:subtilisin family serine protease